MRLASVVVSAPDDASAATGTEKENVLAALRRALVDRVPGDVPGDGHPKPGVFVVAPAPPELSSSAGQRRGWVASGTSVNWYWRRETRKKGDAEEKVAFSFLGTEVTLGGTGRRAGFSKKARSSKKAQSRLCRASLAARYGEVVEKVRARQRRNATRSAGALFADEKKKKGLRRRRRRRDDAFVARDDVRDVEASPFRGVRRARARVPRGAVAVRELDHKTPRARKDVQSVRRRVVKKTRRETRRRFGGGFFFAKVSSFVRDRSTTFHGDQSSPLGTVRAYASS